MSKMYKWKANEMKCNTKTHKRKFTVKVVKILMHDIMNSVVGGVIE